MVASTFGVAPVSHKKKKKRYGKLDLLSPYWRLGRIRFIAYSFLFATLAAALTPIILQFQTLLPTNFGAFTTGMLLMLVYGGFLVILLVMSIKRCHDFDRNGWFSLLLLLPAGVVLLWLIPGTDGVNRYGRDMPPNTWLESIVAMIGLVTILVLGIGFLLL